MVFQMEAREGAQKVRSPQSERTLTLQSWQHSKRLSRDKASYCGRALRWLPACKQTWGSHTVFRLCTGDTTSKAPAVPNSNNSILDTQFIPRQDHLLNIHSIPNIRSCFMGDCSGSRWLSLSSPERNRQIQKTLPKQNSGDRYLRHWYLEEPAKEWRFAFIKLPVILWFWVSHRIYVFLSSCKISLIQQHMAVYYKN